MIFVICLAGICIYNLSYCSVAVTAQISVPVYFILVVYYIIYWTCMRPFDKFPYGCDGKDSSVFRIIQFFFFLFFFIRYNGTPWNHFFNRQGERNHQFDRECFIHSAVYLPVLKHYVCMKMLGIIHLRFHRTLPSTFNMIYLFIYR